MEGDGRLEPLSRFAADKRPRFGTRRATSPMRAWYNSWLAVGWVAPVVDLVRRLASQSHVWSVLVVPCSTADSVVQSLACRSDGIVVDHARDVHYYADFVSWEVDEPARVRALEGKVTLLQADLDVLRRRKDEPISAEQAAPIEAEINSLRVKLAAKKRANGLDSKGPLTECLSKDG